MATITTSDSVKLYYEEAGQGDPIVFVHEFGGHHLSWEQQMRYFSRRYRCISYQARGWPPSDVPQNFESYSQARAADDIADVIKGLGLAKAHVVGLSMGATAGIEFAIRHPGMGLSITAAGAGTGSSRDAELKKRFVGESLSVAKLIEDNSIAALGSVYMNAASRQQLKAKDPRGFAEFYKGFVEGPSQGRALTMRGVQARRVPFFEREAELKAIVDPVLIVAGDEDDATLEASLHFKRTIPRCGLMVFPRTGHGINLEEPAGFNAVVQDFIHAVERGRWGVTVSTAGKGYAMLPKT
ncbi:MAG: alpha/beta fold hydrolase [Hyphomicrobiaceae bacterium]